ncbi:hypothetical protein ACRAWF_38905 [Streptomyces sp. L7]
MNSTPTDEPDRVLVVGRSPSVLVATVDILRAKGYIADATNQFDHVLDDYEVTDLDVLVFGGMVPADTKQYLRGEVSRRNPQVTFVQGLAGIAGVIAAQVEALTADERQDPDGAEITYDVVRRSVQLALKRTRARHCRGSVAHVLRASRAQEHLGRGSSTVITGSESTSSRCSTKCRSKPPSSPSPSTTWSACSLASARCPPQLREWSPPRRTTSDSLEVDQVTTSSDDH